MALGAFVGSVAGALHMFGGRIDSFRHEEDEFARKETVRRTTRIPVQQTIDELGSGPSMFPRPASIHEFHTNALYNSDQGP
jgi:hypothetical protein